MSRLFLALSIVCFASGAFAFHTGPHAPGAKTDDPSRTDRGATDGREGGETIADAFVIPDLPFSDTGATCDNVHDYEETCPFDESFSPDVVYVWTNEFISGYVRIDLCGSSYDTKLYVYENSYTPGFPYACNDDYYLDDGCGMYVSCIEAMPVHPGFTYYIVVDGYSGQCGEYQLRVTPNDICPVPCDGVPEGEPTIVNDYVDTYNGGCASFPPVFQDLWGDGLGCLELCGVGGWYSDQGIDARDTDWFAVTASGTSIEWSVATECPVYMLAFRPEPDCTNYTLVDSRVANPCDPGSMSFATTPGDVYWLWVASITFVPPMQPAEFDYVVDVCGIESAPTAVTKTTWGAVKTMYR